MKRQKLFVMCGCPGSGKTTYAKQYLLEKSNTIYVSRDEIRFSLVDEKDKYFAKEKMVYKTFLKRINEGLKNGYNVIADATHLNHFSRLKLFNQLAYNPLDVETVIVFLDTPLEVCKERNEKRAGTRAYVPFSALYDMYNNIERPYFDEYYKIDTIYFVSPTYTITARRDEKEE